MAELARIIRSDPALVGRLIKAANGIVAMTRRPVVSVQEALMVLGLPAVRTIVFCCSKPCWPQPIGSLPCGMTG